MENLLIFQEKLRNSYIFSAFGPFGPKTTKIWKLCTLKKRMLENLLGFSIISFLKGYNFH